MMQRYAGCFAALPIMDPIPPTPPTLTQPPPAAPKPPAMSLGARLLNVFATPGEVFEDVKGAPVSVANWLLPALLFMLIGILSSAIIFSQPAIKQKLREEQGKAMDKMVQAGKMTREQADQALDVIGKFAKPIAIVSMPFVSFVRMFWWALVLWLLGRWFLKIRFKFLKALEVAGLATMIVVLGSVVTLLLTVNLGRLFATPSLGMLTTDFDATNKIHLMMGAANVFYIWSVCVMAVGLARLAGVPFLRAAWVVFAYWVAQELFFIFCGMGQFAL
jgi:hypothetical protein